MYGNIIATRFFDNVIFSMAVVVVVVTVLESGNFKVWVSIGPVKFVETSKIM